MSVDFINILLAVVGLLLTFVGIVVIPIWIYLNSKKHPYLAPEVPSDSPLPDDSFPNLIQVRNRGSAAASTIRGVIFPEPHLGQDPQGASYTLKGIAYLGKEEVNTYEAQSAATGVPGDWRIKDYSLAPENTEPGITARLTLTYQDEKDRSYASIFDYKRGRGWRPVARLDGIKFGIAALEEIYQKRQRENKPFTPPPDNGFDHKRRILVMAGGMAVIGLTVAGVGIVRFIVPQKANVVSGPTPTPKHMPSPTATPPPPGTTLATYLHGGEVDTVAWSPDGTRVASGSRDSFARVWDVATGTKLVSYQGHSDWIRGVAWSPDGKKIASGSHDKTVQIWDAATGNPILTYHGHLAQVLTVAWSPDGRRIASGSLDRTVQVWDAATGTTILTYSGHTAEVRAVAWSPNGDLLASGSADQTVQLWDALTGGQVLTYHGHSLGVNSVAWSPDAQSLASASDDHTAKVWDAATGGNTLIITYRHHTDLVRSVRWSPNGKRIASGSADRTAQIWDGQGVNQFVYTGHSNWVHAVAWSPDGRRIASGSADKTVQIWQGA